MKINLKRLNLAQAQACLTGKEIQERSQISDVSLARIRSGKQEPRPQTVGRLAKALGVSVEYLIEEAV